MKKKFIKKFVTLSTAGIIMITCVFSTITWAKAGGYSSTYEMTGGVFSDWITPTSKCTVTVTPTVGTYGQDMGVIWAYKTWYGWDGTQKWTSSTKQGTVSFESNKRRKVWLRNYTGQKWTGKVKFTWD